jgi:hypothetical protein
MEYSSVIFTDILDQICQNVYLYILNNFDNRSDSDKKLVTSVFSNKCSQKMIWEQSAFYKSCRPF